MPFSVTKIRRLASLFPDDSRKMLHAHLARLSALYEDMRIELHGASEENLHALDAETSESYRRNYFHRRSIATLLEFAEAFRLIDGDADFQSIKTEFEPNDARQWQRALAYFARQETMFGNVRNDVGGHFGVKAAKWAVENFDTQVGMLEYWTDQQVRGGFRLKFAGEFIGAAMGRHLKGKTGPQQSNFLLKRCKFGYIHAGRAVEVIIRRYLWQRFGQ